MTPVCRLDQIEPESGVTALVEGRAIALFRTHDDRLYALDNYDPFAQASVLARGIVGTLTRDGEVVDMVASPMHKQRFDLRTGRCLDDPAVGVPAYDVALKGDLVLVGGVRARDAGAYAGAPTGHGGADE